MDNNIDGGKDGREDEDGRQANLWELKRHAFSKAALEIILGDIVVKVTSMIEGSSIQIVT